MRISDCIRINNGQNLKIIVTMLATSPALASVALRSCFLCFLRHTRGDTYLPHPEPQQLSLTLAATTQRETCFST